MYNERFARQYHDGLPPEFPQTSPFTGTVHHLSGPNAHAHTQTCSNRFVGNSHCELFNYIYCALHDRGSELAHTLDSLVRVSRRAGHTYGSTYVNTAHCYTHTAYILSQPAPDLLIAQPVYCTIEMHRTEYTHACLSGVDLATVYKHMPTACHIKWFMWRDASLVAWSNQQHR